MRVVFALLALFCVVFAWEQGFDPLLALPQQLGRDSDPPREPLTFKWDNCGSAPVKLNQLSISPDPLVLGQPISVQIAASVGAALTTSNMDHVAITLEKSVLGIWVEIPCVDNAGSCTYANPCALLNDNKAKCATDPNCICNIVSKFPSPRPNCTCPISAGNYGPYSFNANTHNPGVSWLTNGDYYAKVELQDANNNDLMCLEVYLSLSAS
eukprot:TRINITY_DN683_c0_g1_i1.p2 TRINITY_DN683_c0_g1~~TRINITY_DN683_c0_g1_i1.p2  ORF type:complete len:211 (+),score=42.62 TRINITY_DN683_c0_g1_i1:1240-1872(+)